MGGKLHFYFIFHFKSIFKVGIYSSIKLTLIQTNYLQSIVYTKIEKNSIYNQRHILQVHLSAVQSLILFLKCDRVGTCLILSSRVFHRKLPRKDSESSPKPSVLILGSLHKFCILRLYIMGFFS